MKLWKLLSVVAGAGQPAAPDWTVAQRLLSEKVAAEQKAADLSAEITRLHTTDTAEAVAEARELAGRLALHGGAAEQKLARSRRVAALERKADRSVAALLHRATHAQVSLGSAVQQLEHGRAEATLEAASLRSTHVAEAQALQGWEKSAKTVQDGLESAYRTNQRLQEVLDTVTRDSAQKEEKLVQQNKLLQTRLQTTLERERGHSAEVANATQRAEVAERSLARLAVQEHVEAAAVDKAAEATRQAVLAERSKQRTDAHELAAAKKQVQKLTRDNEEAAAEITHLQEELRAERAAKQGKVVPQPERVRR